MRGVGSWASLRAADRVQEKPRRVMAEGQPLGPTTWAHARRSGLSCDLRQVSVSRCLGFLICREDLPSRKREALCAGLDPEQDLVPDHHGNSTWSYRCGHPSPRLSLPLLPQADPWALSQRLGAESEALAWPPRSQSTRLCFPFSPIPRRPSLPEHTPFLLRPPGPQRSHRHGDYGVTCATWRACPSPASTPASSTARCPSRAGLGEGRTSSALWTFVSAGPGSGLARLRAPGHAVRGGGRRGRDR